jgi:hypothetical protein
VKRHRQALTLVELLVALAMSTILMMALGYSFATGLDLERNRAARRQSDRQVDAFEERMRSLLQGAKLRETDDETLATFFVGTLEGGDDSLGCDRLTFTTTGPGASLSDRADDRTFEERNTEVGPQGGMTEVSFGLVPVGQTAQTEGLFERIQTPADVDPDQGGTESVLSQGIVRIGFTFWDGVDWAAQWDTLSSTERRLPAVVRIRYVLADDPEDRIREFLVTIPGSDIDIDNPLNSGATQ